LQASRAARDLLAPSGALIDYCEIPSAHDYAGMRISFGDRLIELTRALGTLAG
jgi:hypothetical protein